MPTEGNKKSLKPCTSRNQKKKIKTNPQVNRGKEIMKIGAEINEIETNKIIENSSKTKIWFFEKRNQIGKLQLDSPSNKREDSNK